MARLALSRLPFQVPPLVGSGRFGLGARPERMAQLGRAADFFAAGRPSLWRAAVPAVTAADGNVSAPEGAKLKTHENPFGFVGPTLFLTGREKASPLGVAASAPRYAVVVAGRFRYAAGVGSRGASWPSSAGFKAVRPNPSVNRTLTFPRKR